MNTENQATHDNPSAQHCPFGAQSAAPVQASLTDAAVRSSPHSYYGAMRAQDPVHYDPPLGMYMVTRYEDLVTVLRDADSYSVKHGYEALYAAGFFEEFKQILEREGGGFFPDAIMTDPPYHTRVRRLMEKAFTAHRVKQLEPGMSKVIVDVIDRTASKGAIDAVADLAAPITIGIICEQLGFDHFDADKIQRWSHAITAQISKLQTREEMRAHTAQICELQHYLIKHVRDREAHPREDMISDLVHAREEGSEQPTLTFHEVVSLVRALLIAGNETTTTAITRLMLLLATQPAQARQLQAAVDQDDDRTLTRFVEEFLRCEPPIFGTTRMTTREVVLAGTKLPKGAHLLLLYPSGNEDEKEFPCPRDFDLQRANLGRHLTFGAGVHRCIGLSLARMEIKVTAREIARRLSEIKLAIPVDKLTYLPTVSVRALASLPVNVTRRG